MSNKLTPIAGLSIQDTTPLSSTLVDTPEVIDGNKDVTVCIYGVGSGTGYANCSAIGVDLGVQCLVDTIIVRCTANVVSGDDEWYPPPPVGTDWAQNVYVYSSDDNSTWELLQHWDNADLAPLTADGGFLNHMTLVLTTPKLARYFKVGNAVPGAGLGVWKQKYSSQPLNATEMEVYGVVDRYWVGGSYPNNLFHDTANWSLASGGAGGASVPTTGDTAIFEEGVEEVRIQDTVLCHLNTYAARDTLYFVIEKNTAEHASLSLQEDLYCKQVSVQTFGEFETNNYNIYFKQGLFTIYASNVDLGTSIVTINSGIDLWNVYFTDELYGTHIVSQASFVINSNLEGEGYGQLQFLGKTIKSLDINGDGIINGEDSVVIGNPSGLTIDGATEGGLEINGFVVSMASGIASIYNCTLVDCEASGGASFNALLDNGNIDGGGNTGWLFYISSAVTTQAVTDILTTSFTANGNVTDDGDNTITRRGFCYAAASTGNPEIGGEGVLEVHEDGSFSIGSFSLPITSLSSYTNYRVRAYAVNSIGTTYGNTVDVLTLPNITVTTSPCSGVTPSSFKANAIISPSIYNVTSIGFDYWPTDNPSAILRSYSSGDYLGTVNFSKTVGAAVNTEYSVRAFVVYAGSTYYYGETVTVSTIVLSSISVSPVIPQLNIGQTVQMTITGNYTDGSVVDLTSVSAYSIADIAEFTIVPEEGNTYVINEITGQIIASISSSGLITGLSAGIARIDITASEFQTAFNLVVVQPDDGTVDIGGVWDGSDPSIVLLNLTAVSIVMDAVMYEGASQQAYLMGIFDDSPETEALLNNYDATWTSSNTDVATIDSGGLITAIAKGITFIKVTYVVADSPEETFTSMLMLRIEPKEGQWVDDQNYQYIPLLPQPNQSFKVTVATSADRSVSLNIFLGWNKESECWEMTISDPVSEEYYVDSVPLFSGKNSTFNILKNYQYLDIGSCFIVDISGKGTEKPNTEDLGIDFVMIWGYTE